MSRLQACLVFCSFVLLLSSCAKPEAKFEVQIPAQAAPVEVSFKNTSVNAEKYNWEFGDGATSTEQNPTHLFQNFGEMRVVLRAYKGEEMSADTQIVNIPEPPRRKVVIETDMGNMVVELSNLTPKHRDNFIKLAGEGFFDDLLFHRVIQNFMIQGGDPDSRNAAPEKMLGGGGPNYTIPAEFHPSLIHTKGALSAARLGDGVNPEKASSGSQFYIVQGQTMQQAQLAQIARQNRMNYTAAQIQQYEHTGGAPFLDGGYTVFGYVIEGLDVIDKIAATPTSQFVKDRPNKDVKMKVRILE